MTHPPPGPDPGAPPSGPSRAVGLHVTHYLIRAFAAGRCVAYAVRDAWDGWSVVRRVARNEYRSQRAESRDEAETALLWLADRFQPVRRT